MHYTVDSLTLNEAYFVTFIDEMDIYVQRSCRDFVYQDRVGDDGLCVKCFSEISFLFSFFFVKKDANDSLRCVYILNEQLVIY